METCIRLFANKEQIRDCKAKVNANATTFKELANILSLTGNEARLKILYLLEQEKELCPCDLSDILGMSIPAISQHLRKLKDSSVIEFRKEGQTIYYSLRANHIAILKPLFEHIHLATEMK